MIFISACAEGFTLNYSGFIFSPWRACAARVTVVGLSVCMSLFLLVNISRLQHLFVLKMSHTQRATKAKITSNFSETAPLPRSSTSCIVWLSVWMAILTLWKTCMCIIRPRIALSCLDVLSAACVASYYVWLATVAKMQSCPASDSSKDRVDTLPAKKRSMCESVCSLISIY